MGGLSSSISTLYIKQNLTIHAERIAVTKKGIIDGDAVALSIQAGISQNELSFATAHGLAIGPIPSSWSILLRITTSRIL